MKKIILSVLAACVSSVTFAGGILTNTNQNAAFLRQMSQDAIIDINGLVMNPAGTAFLANGWHLSVTVQNAKQNRDITTTFPLFAYNTNNREQTHKFEGNAYAPVIPSFQISYNRDKWSVNANFSLGGGGGKCEFDNGLGSFEALYGATILGNATLVTAGVKRGLQEEVVGALTSAGHSAEDAAAMAATGSYDTRLTGYSMDAYMKGRQYYFGLQLGATYKVKDNLAVFAGLRGVYATCNYNGYVQDVKAVVGYSMNVPAAGINQTGDYSVDMSERNLALNCDQKGFGATPILGIDWMVNEHWNFAAKYEFETSIRLKNKTEMNDVAKQEVDKGNATLAQFKDGDRVHANIAGILTLGAQYSPVKKVRTNVGFHYYLDKRAKQYGDKQKLLDKNTWELIAGAEWDICKYFTLSGSWQRCKYGFGKDYMNDLSFSLSNNSLGVGFRINATERFRIDFGYMHTFYQDRTVAVATSVGQKSDFYHRDNRVFGLGINLDF